MPSPSAFSRRCVRIIRIATSPSSSFRRWPSLRRPLNSSGANSTLPPQSLGERGYHRSRALGYSEARLSPDRSVIGWGFSSGTNGLREPSSLRVQRCPVAQLRCLWCTGPGGCSTPPGPPLLYDPFVPECHPPNAGVLIRGGFASSGSFAMFAAMRRASSRVSRFAPIVPLIHKK